jgi:hypothetical protein
MGLLLEIDGIEQYHERHKNITLYKVDHEGQKSCNLWLRHSMATG